MPLIPSGDSHLNVIWLIGLNVHYVPIVFGCPIDLTVFIIMQYHTFFCVPVPHPPRNLTIEKVTSNSVLVRWEPPLDSIFSEYSIR